MSRRMLLFGAIAGPLALGLLVQTVNELWGFDLWDHAAVVLEFRDAPFHPSHPLITADTPHPFMTPYSWAVGRVAAATSSDPFDALKVGAFANLAILISGFYGYVRRRSESPRAPAVALLLALFLWGPGAWHFSGFIHLGVIGLTLPYPSIFALGCALWAGNTARDFLQRGGVLRVSALAALSALVLLSHPIAAVFLVTLVVADLCTLPAKRHDQVLVVAAGGAAVVVSLLWPFYPILDLLTEVTPQTHAENRVMYDRTWLRTLPIVIGFGLAARVLWRRNRDIIIVVTCLGAVFLAGGLSGSWSLGRVVSPAALVAQVGIAIAALEAFRPTRWVVAGGVAIVLPMSVLAVTPEAIRLVPRSLLPHIGDRPGLRAITYQYEHLENDAGRGPTITVSEHAHVLPSFGIKLVALPRPHPFVDDAEARAEASSRFFESAPSGRREIAERYGVRSVAVESTNQSCDRSTGGPLRLISIDDCL